MNRNPAAAAFLCGLVVKFDCGADLAGRAKHHVPGQASDFTRAEPSFDGQQDEDPVSIGIPGRTNVRQEISQMSIRKNFGLLACHGSEL